MSPRPTAAFFDLDKTIIATSSALAFGREFMHNGLVTRAEAMHFSLVKASYLVSGQTSEQMDTTRDQLTALVAGWDVNEVQRITTEAMHSVVTPVIYAEARDLIRQHREAGRDVVIVSASVTHLVHPIAAELGIAPEDVIASELEVEQGRFTGEVLAYLKGPAKAEAMRAMAERRGYDMAGSYAYSDSATDVPMLEQVGNPVAVNPDRALKKAALERGWTIRSFKDPVPLVTLPTARDIGIGAGVLAGLAAVTAGSIWIAQRGRNSSAS